MTIIDILLVALGLSADAFAVSVSIGLTMTKPKWQKAITVGLYFGVFQAGMPIIGYILALWFAGHIGDYGNLVAFVVLCIIGGKMIFESLKNKNQDQKEVSLLPIHLVPLAIATSIDALAVGASFAFLQVNILNLAPIIGVITFALSIIGVRIGNAFGDKLQSKANLAGGIILILIGLRILSGNIL